MIFASFESCASDTDRSLEHPENALEPIVLTEDGRDTDSRSGIELNALDEMYSMVFPPILPGIVSDVMVAPDADLTP